MRVRSDDPGDDPGANPVEHFLVDGVAPPVIGAGPPELRDDNGSRHARHDTGPTARGSASRHSPHHEPGFDPGHRSEPPTSPIPVVHTLPPEREPEKRRSWVAKVLRLPRR